MTREEVGDELAEEVGLVKVFERQHDRVSVKLPSGDMHHYGADMGRGSVLLHLLALLGHPVQFLVAEERIETDVVMAGDAWRKGEEEAS